MAFEQDIDKYQGQILTQAVLMDLLKDYRWPHNRIAKMEKKGWLVPLKRGIYITGPNLKLPRPSLFLMANHIYGPSYVSNEAALWHWGLIPEKVVNITSMTTGSSKTFPTTSGVFVYIKARFPYYSFDIRQVEVEKNQNVLMASPEKALCDLIISRAGVLLRSPKSTLDFLINDLRIEKTALGELNNEVLKTWIEQVPKKTSINMLIKTLANL